MAMQNHVRNPLEWGWDKFKQASQAVGSTADAMDRAWEDRATAPPTVRAVRMNPGPMAMWGFIVAASLFVGALPLLIGLAIALPVLGHATWHLYRKLVT